MNQPGRIELHGAHPILKPLNKKFAGRRINPHKIQRQEGVCLARDEESHLMVRPGCPQSSKA